MPDTYEVLTAALLIIIALELRRHAADVTPPGSEMCSTTTTTLQQVSIAGSHGVSSTGLIHLKERPALLLVIIVLVIILLVFILTRILEPLNEFGSLWEQHQCCFHSRGLIFITSRMH
jgi:hypothetical protein